MGGSIIIWLEVWALLIPLAVVWLRPKQPAFLHPIIIYLFVAFFLNLAATLIWQRKVLNLNITYDNNNPIYNLHSMARLLFFSAFFIRLQQPFLKIIEWLVPVVFIGFAAINFIFFEDFVRLRISSRLHLVESGLLLFLCLQYYLYLLKSEQASFLKMPDFWVVTGLAIFIIGSFSIYFFYDRMVEEEIKLAIDIWEVQKAAFLLFCLLLAKAFYGR